MSKCSHSFKRLFNIVNNYYYYRCELCEMDITEDHYAVLGELNKYRSALHIIAHMGVSGLSWQHDFEKCVNIASEALGFARKNL